MKKKIFAILLVMVLFVLPMEAMAETIDFNITVGGFNPDPISRRAIKNPADSDNNFYVRGVTFSTSQPVIAASYHLSQPNTYYSYGVQIRSYTTSTAYCVKVPHGEYYYMNTDFADGQGTATHITGKYTP